MRADGQAVVITGASAGIGRATARWFAARGARVALLARGEAGLAGAAADVREVGGVPLALPVDVSDYHRVDAAAARIEEELGPIDVWVNNAFTGVYAPFVHTAPHEIRRVTEVTYLGYVHGTRAALDRMLPRDRGVIVQVGSGLAHRGFPLQAPYCAAKHAIKGFTESLRCELLHQRSHVRVTMVQLPSVNTPQFRWVLSRLDRQARPVSPVYQPEVAAQAIGYAAAHPRREYWVGAGTVLLLLANRIAPGLLDHYLARTGYRSQQTPEPRDVRNPSNLWDPADGAGEPDFGVHGAFDDRAHERSTQAWLSRHRKVTAGLALAGVGAAVAGARRRHGP